MDAVKSRRALYAQQTRTALLDASARAFASGGYTGTSIASIAATAQVTKGAVYHHFADKAGLFAAVMDRQEEKAEGQVLRAIAQHPDDVWAAAMEALDATLDICCDPIVGRLIYLEGPVGLGWRRWRDYERRYTFSNVDLLLRSAIDAGIYPKSMPIGAMTQIIAGMITHAGIALAETPDRKRKVIRADLRSAILHVLEGLRIAAPTDQQ